MELRYFLVEFDGHTYPAKITVFDDVKLALAELSVREPLEPPGGETVLLGAASEDVLRVTHSRYFEDPFVTYMGRAREHLDAPQRSVVRDFARAE